MFVTALMCIGACYSEHGKQFLYAQRLILRPTSYVILAR